MRESPRNVRTAAISCNGYSCKQKCVADPKAGHYTEPSGTPLKRRNQSQRAR
jgi:hypothetical protein